VHSFRSSIKQSLRLLSILLLCAQPSLTQQPNSGLRGQVKDQLGAVIVGATVTATNGAGEAKSTKTNNEGVFIINGLAPGRYAVRAEAAGFAAYENKAVEIEAGRPASLNIKLDAAIAEQKVNVQSAAPVSTDPENNAGAVVIRGKNLDALPDDPEDLKAVLEALAGPAAGPGGAQFYVDGFTAGSRLPPKDTIREIRINQNPFSAEFDRMGFGSIQIITRPGTDKFHGHGAFNFSDESLNSRNPFAMNRAPYQSRFYFGGVSGPLLAKRATFYINGGRRETDDNAIINATILDRSLNVAPFSSAVVTPQRDGGLNLRLDLQINPKHTLSAQYNYSRSSQENAGIGEFSLPSRAHTTANREQIARLTETAILSARVVNETRFQFIHSHRSQTGVDSTPSINALEAFLGGGSPIGISSISENRYELHNNTTAGAGSHTLKFGGRLRGVSVADISRLNFNGTYAFAGGLAPRLDINNQVVRDAGGAVALEQITSVERYRRTLVFLQQRRSPAEVRELGGGATQFSIAGGDSEALITQMDFGGFIHNDWRVTPNFTLSSGLRYEAQNNIDSHLDLAPRLAFAWAPGKNSSGPRRTVIRGGFGVFFDRFNENYSLQARRYNGVNQQQYVVSDPSVLDLFPTPPATSALAAFGLPQTTRLAPPDLRTPYTLQSAFSLERQLPFNFTASANFLYTRTLHLLRSRNLTAPLPGGARPPGDGGAVLAYESSGIHKQRQLIIGVNNFVGRRLNLFVNYILNQARSDTDGAETFPENTYDLRGEFGRSRLDVRHRFILGGALNAPWGVSLSPLVVARSGTPFNITTGRDTNGDTQFTERPAFATDFTRPGVIITRSGAFDPNVAPGERVIPRNFGDGPSFVSVNMRLSKRFNFGPRPGNGQVAQAPPSGASRAATSQARQPERPFSLTFTAQIQNLFNHVNAAPPIGNLSSPLFGLSNATAVGGYQLGSGAPATSNRRIVLELNLNF
jgi:carboxypeptidase family protein